MDDSVQVTSAAPDIFWAITLGACAMVALTSVIIGFVLDGKRLRIAHRLALEARDREAEMERMAAHLQASEETIDHAANEIHDQLGDSLNLLVRVFRDLQAMEASPQVRAKLDIGFRGARMAKEQVRSISRILHGDDGSDQGLAAAVRTHVESVREYASERIELDVRLGEEAWIPPLHRSPLLRIAQAAITNALKHARAQRIDVTLSAAEGSLLVSVRDDGVGFDTGKRPGMRSQRDRAAKIGGVLTVASAPGSGTTVSLRLPLTPRPTYDESEFDEE